MAILTIPNNYYKEHTDETEPVIKSIVRQQRSYFGTGATLDIHFRIEQLNRLRYAIAENEQILLQAMESDLGRSSRESYFTEISVVMQELSYHINRLSAWAKPRLIRTPLHLFPSASKVTYQPLGIALIIAPWYFPFRQLLLPLTGAISAGCCTILKASPLTPHTNKIIERIIAACFDPAYITILKEGENTDAHLLQERYDILFYNGPHQGGISVSRAAAEHLTPVILELEQPVPCIVDKSANLAIAARRIIWGKMLNAGQSNIAPDRLYVQQEIAETFKAHLIAAIREFFGDDSSKSPHYSRIINDYALKRLSGLLDNTTVVYGGNTIPEERYMDPTIIEHIPDDHPILQQPVFGPILPLIPFTHLEEVIHILTTKDKPLALYYFGDKRSADYIQNNTFSGGICINDVMLHRANPHLPFGGVGQSGSGYYRGRESFLAFSHKRALLHTITWFDSPLRYVPYRYFKWIRNMI